MVKPISMRRLANIKLADLARIAAALRERGEILDPGPWLRVLANMLSSAPAKYDGDRRGKHAPEYFGLSEARLDMEARRAGLHVTLDQIAEQVAATKAWRKTESKRQGHPHYAPMSPETIGRLLGVTAEVRMETKAWSIIPYGATKEQMMEQYKERHREREVMRKRARGATPREQSFSRTKPWERLGMSRRTWERKGKPAPPPDEGPKIVIPRDRILH